MSQQLKRGARQSLDYYDEQLNTIERRARAHQDFETMAALANLRRRVRQGHLQGHYARC